MLDLEPIKKRLAEASPGPWSWDCDLLRQGEYGEPVLGSEPVYDGGEMIGSTTVVLRTDAALIAHAPTDLAALVAEVERLRTGIASHGTRCRL